MLSQIAYETCQKYLAIAKEQLGYRHPMPTITMDVRGCAAGYANSIDNTIRLNPILFRDNQDAFVSRTIPHELAHIVANRLYGVDRTKTGKRRSHGPRWKQVMETFGCDSSRCHSYDVENARARKRSPQKRWAYRCRCQIMHLSTTRHNKIMRGTTYSCRKCGGHLRRA